MKRLTVAQALPGFREYEWCDLALAASVLVRIRQPEVEHRVQIRDFYNWLEAAGRSPARDDLEEPSTRYSFEVTM
jgi:hypothetical protein